jgi:hypothetical protein
VLKEKRKLRTTQDEEKQEVIKARVVVTGPKVGTIDQLKTAAIPAVKKGS